MALFHPVARQFALYSLPIKQFTRQVTSKAWMQRHVTDYYVKKSVDSGLRSRSAFKLKEIQDKYHLIKKNDFVLDLGCAPGGWSVVIADILDPAHNGLLLSVDLLPMEKVKSYVQVVGDMTDPSIILQLKQLTGGRLSNVIVSDMMANTSGNHMTDHYRSMDLCYIGLDMCRSMLGSGGTFLCKYFKGEDENELISEAKELFSTVKPIKPKASRSESAENYLLCIGKKR